jgi:hypothetical protein
VNFFPNVISTPNPFKMSDIYTYIALIRDILASDMRNKTKCSKLWGLLKVVWKKSLDFESNAWLVTEMEKLYAKLAHVVFFDRLLDELSQAPGGESGKAMFKRFAEKAARFRSKVYAAMDDEKRWWVVVG